MPLIYKILTALLAFTGCAGLLITGQLNPIMLISGIALIPGYLRFLKDKPPLSRWAIGGLSIATLLIFIFDSLILSGDTFIAVAHLTIVFQAIKSFDLKEPWDHLQVYFMALLQLIIASELTRSAAFGIVFVIFLIALVTAMVISHFLKEGTIKKIRFVGPVVSVSILALVITGIFFVSAPRAKGGFFGKSRAKGIKTVGFSDKVDFGSYGDVKLDPTIIMRVEMVETKIPLYWRGMTLDYFDGVSWKNTLKNRYRVYRQGSAFVITFFSPEKALMQKIFIEPIDSDVIFGLETIAGVEIEIRSMLYDDSGSVFTSEKSLRRLGYTVYSIPERTPYSYYPPYLQLPANISRIESLAKEITKGLNTGIERAKKIEAYLRDNYGYSLATSPPPKGISPVDYFLFSSKQGYCEHYATSMVLMLRSIGIPSRIVTGFAGGEKNKYGGYIIIRQSNAHSWVEAAVNGRWMRFDPTPQAEPSEMPPSFLLYIDSLRMKWYRYVVNFSSSDQKEIIGFLLKPLIKIPHSSEMRYWILKKIFYAIFVLAGVSSIIFLLKRLRIQRYGPVTNSYLEFRNSVSHKGGNITGSSTPSDVLREAIRLDAGKEAGEFIILYEKARFGGKKLTLNEEARYKSIVKNLKKRK